MDGIRCQKLNYFRRKNSIVIQIPVLAYSWTCVGSSISFFECDFFKPFSCQIHNLSFSTSFFSKTSPQLEYLLYDWKTLLVFLIHFLNIHSY